MVSTTTGQRVFRPIRRRRVGSLPHCIAFGTADVGEAVLEDGRTVYTTWGRNIPVADLDAVLRRVTYDCMLIGGRNGAWFEYILPSGDGLDALLKVMRKDIGGWVSDV